MLGFKSQAMDEEYDALLKNQTWTLVPPSSSMNIVGCRWICKIKCNADGSVEQHKAHLVVKGYTSTSFC